MQRVSPCAGTINELYHGQHGLEYVRLFCLCVCCAELNSLSSASRTHKDTHAEGLTGGAQLGMSLAASTLAARAAAAAASLPLEITQAAQQLTAQLITDPSQQPPPLTPADMFTFTKVRVVMSYTQSSA